MSSTLFLICVLSLICSINGINNGEIISIDKVPYVVGLQLRVCSLRGSTWCTGGIIHKSFILTAGHCFTKNVPGPGAVRPQKYVHYKVKVYANTDSMMKKSKNAIKAKGTDVYFIKQYLKDGIDDIAILKLDCDLNEGTITILQYPSKNYIVSDQYAVVAGYGGDPENDEINEQAKRSLKYMHAKINEPSSCCRIYMRKCWRVVAEKHLCMQALPFLPDSLAGKELDYSVGTWKGDSGAPIVTKGNIVIGVTHIGADINKRVTPGLIMRVSNYANFIDTIINDQPIDHDNIVHYKLTSTCTIL